MHDRAALYRGGYWKGSGEVISAGGDRAALYRGGYWKWRNIKGHTNADRAALFRGGCQKQPFPLASSPETKPFKRLSASRPETKSVSIT